MSKIERGEPFVTPARPAKPAGSGAPAVPAAPAVAAKVEYLVLSEPMGATVFLDGERLGRTPPWITRPAGSAPRTVRFELEGWMSAEVTGVSAAPGATVRVSATLTQALAGP